MSEAIDLAVAEAKPPTAAKRKQSCYVQLGRAPLFFWHSVIPSATQTIPHLAFDSQGSFSDDRLIFSLFAKYIAGLML
jgi:hypothetical protein